MRAISRVTVLLIKEQGSQKAAKLALGTAMAQGLGILFYPFLARLYTPEEMGTFGLYSAFIGIVTVGTSLRFEAASVVSKGPREGMALVNLSFLLTFPTTLLMCLLLYWMIQLNLMGFGSLSPVSIPLIGLSLVLGGVFVTLRFWLIRESDFGLVAKVTAQQVFVRLCSQSLLGLTHFGWLGLAFGDLLGRMSGVTSIWSKVSETWKRWGHLNFSRLKIVAFRHRDYALFGFPSAILDSISGNIAIPFFASSYGLETAGYLALIQRILSAPVSLLGGSVGEVFHSRIAEIQRSGTNSAERLFRFIALRALIISFPCTAILMIFGRQLTVLIFGERWEPAGYYMVALAPMLMMQFIVTPLCRSIFVFNGQKLKLIYDLFVLVGSLFVLVLGPRWLWSANFTVAALSGVNSLGYLIYFFLIWSIVRGK